MLLLGFVLLALYLFRSNVVTLVRLSTEMRFDIIELNLNRERQEIRNLTRALTANGLKKA